jgi:ABC-2 type transport system permease protein
MSRPLASTTAFDGVRPMSTLGGLATLYTLTLRQHLHGKRWIAMVALFLLPAGLATLVRSTSAESRPMEMEFLLAMMFIPQLVLPLTALLYSSGMIQDELEDQTITYLLIRPLPRWAIYLVKLLATVTTTVVLTAFFTALTFAAIYAGVEAPPDGVLSRCGKVIAIHALGVTTYCALFGYLGLMTKRSLVVGIVYSVAIEGLLANMPFGIRLATVIYYTRIIAYRSMSYTLEFPHRTINMAAEAWQLNVQNDPQLLEHPTMATCVMVLLGASCVLAALGALNCARREFHVKTPEKG